MRALALAVLACALFANGARATTVNDTVGDFLATFSGPHGADLDVVSTTAVLSGTDLTLSATLGGAVGTTAGGALSSLCLVALARRSAAD